MTPMVFLNVYTASNGVSGDLTEAAKVDGANAWQTLIYVIYPVIMPILLITFLERILAGFLMFSLVFALTGGGPGIFTQSASIFIWNTAFASGDFGVANAASYILALLLLFPALYLVRRMMRTIL
jgi:multiple sugar transport system permease protein